MRKALGAILPLAVCFLFSGLDISRDSSDGHASWRVSLASPAYAQFSGCESGGDDPDGDGDECNPTYSQDVHPQKNLGHPDCNGCGDPINFATGSLYESQADYAAVGPLPLVLNRYYNSQDPGIHQFGANWRGSFGRSLVKTSSTVATVTRDDAQVFTFTLTSGVWTAEVDVNFRLTAVGSGWSLVTDQDETETYDANGRLTSFANRAGLTETFSYDAQGRLTTVTDPFGRTMTFTYASAASPLIIRMTAPDGGVYSYAYDSSSRLVSVTFPDSSTRQYVYENTTFPTNMTGVIDEKGRRFATFAYDTSGRAISTQQAGGAELYTVDYSQVASVGVVGVTGPLGGATFYALQAISGTAKHRAVTRSCSNCPSFAGGFLDNAYDTNGNLTVHLDYNNNTTTYAYDTTRNLETSRTLASGTSIARRIATTWHPNYRLPTRIVDGARTVTNSYDAKGNLLSSTLTAPSLTSTRSFTYNSAGQVLTATDPRGNVTTYAYDARGNVASITNALGHRTLFTSYDTNGRPLSIQNPNGFVTTLTYNFRGQVTSKTMLTLVTTYGYNIAGSLTGVTRPDGSFLRMTYDAAHRLVGVADTLGNTIAYTLDAAGNRILTQVFDPAHTLRQTHSRVFDGFSRLYQDIGAASQASTFSYDNNSNVYFFSNPLGIGTQNFFDALDRVTQTTKNGSLTSFNYDALGRLANVTDPRSLATNYTYDGLDDQTSIASPDTGGTTKTFDAAGNLATSTDANGNVTTYTYDAINRVTRQSVSGGTVISFQYDQGANAIGYRTAMTDPSGTTTWAYNRFGQVNVRQQTLGTVTLFTRWVYTSSALIGGIVYPSGALVSFTYDANARVNGITYQPTVTGPTSALLSQITYQPFGPVASWHNANGTTYSRTYDQDGRVSALAMPAGQNVALTYDSASRITGMTETGLSAKSFAYDNLDRLIRYGSGSLTETYGYDTVGNRTAYTTNLPSSVSYTYQYAATSNRLASISGSASETYGYDAAGNTTLHATPLATYSFAYNSRDRQSQVTIGTSVRTYQTDGLGQRIAKLNGSLYLTLFSYDAAGHMMGFYNGDGSLFQETVWLGDLPVALLVPGAQLFIAPDHLGAPHQVTSAAGATVWLWDHDPFGNGTPIGSLVYNLRFPGQYFDQQTGLHYNYFRDYDPLKGRYIESDPIGMRGGINTYLYAGANPIISIDPFGSDLESVLWSGAKGFAYGVGATVVVVAVAAGAVAVGVPAAIVTGGLLVVGTVGGIVTVVKGVKDYQAGNWNGLAFDLGSLGGSVAAGSALGGPLGDLLSPGGASRGWSPTRDWANRYDPSRGSPWDWLATGPDAPAAAGALTLGGAGAAQGASAAQAELCK
jgi:RHS repeat-associated protein